MSSRAQSSDTYSFLRRLFYNPHHNRQKKDIWEFEKLEQQLHSLLTEIFELSRKKPNDSLNKFKLKFINGGLDGLNKLLRDERPFQDFQLFDVDDLPSNSDVVMILSQYNAAILRFRTEQTTYEQGKYYWIINGKTSKLEAGDPEDFKYQSR
ncbi:MAG: hypothetical protein NVS1B11_25790 [Terriglobales bacterium]